MLNELRQISMVRRLLGHLWVLCAYVLCVFGCVCEILQNNSGIHLISLHWRREVEGGFVKVWLLNPRTGSDYKIIQSPIPLGCWSNDSDWSLHSLYGDVCLHLIRCLLLNVNFLIKNKLIWFSFPFQFRCIMLACEMLMLSWILLVKRPRSASFLF